ncbi:MAG: hypothetical protein NZM35_04170 [Chitinophagales bacterium]|nr:hypothetical protein [Chitinophagales bacterium]MDW8418397.1 glycosyltransferase [Chitinophagales bacterium]
MKENIYVFVVCGDKEHLDTLHYALTALKKFSQNKIWVVTDSRRNDTPIIHEHVLDIKTPDNLTRHQASIYLKTGLYRFLPAGNFYCYLDTDVVAVSPKVDEIFHEYVPPVTFAPDHCNLSRFSPSAVNCGCVEEFKMRTNELRYLFKKYRHLTRPPENELKKQALIKKLDEIKKDKLRYKLISVKFNLSRFTFRLDEDNFLDKRKHYWHDAAGNVILYEREDDAILQIEQATDYRCDTKNNHTWTYHGKKVFTEELACDHLREQIEKTFQIRITAPEWQHWNGGVFLFDERGFEFLRRWHEKTLRIFSMPEWKTRDQGTLAATTWEFGLQNHPTLPETYNLIADYHQPVYHYLGGMRFKSVKNDKIFEPHFIHVYHHWADHEWPVWQEVEKRTGLHVPPQENTINALWIGDRLSPLELLTIYSFLEHGMKFRLWAYDKIRTPLPQGTIAEDANDIIPREKIFRYKNKSQFGHGKGSVAGFSDIFRYKLLYEHGGWWVDMDVTCLKKFDFHQPYFFRKHHNLNVVGNVMKCPKGSVLMKRCYEEAVEQVDAYNADWHKPIHILNKHIQALQLENYIVSDCGNQDRWDDTGRFVYGKEEYPDHWYFIHWQNEEWRHKKISKRYFCHYSTLAEFLYHYGLYRRPGGVVSQWLNELYYLPAWRRFRERIFSLF